MVAKHTQCALLHDDCASRVYWNCAGLMGESLMATASCVAWCYTATAACLSCVELNAWQQLAGKFVDTLTAAI